MSFPDADPWDPQDYSKLIGQWKQMIENNPLVNCKDVAIKEILTIGSIDDYEDWRHNRGEYGAAGQINGVTYPVPAVSPHDLERVWEAMLSGVSTEGICQPGANVEAVMARCIFLSVLCEEGHLPDWENDPARAESIFQHAATFQLDRPDQKTAVLFLAGLPKH